MSMLRYLFYVCAYYNILLRAIHIPDVSNCFADCLSRLQVSKFHRLCPAASEHPTFVSRTLLIEPTPELNDSFSASVTRTA